jgi:hypothetical protein
MTSVEQVCHGIVCIQGIGFDLPLNFFASATQKVFVRKILYVQSENKTIWAFKKFPISRPSKPSS